MQWAKKRVLDKIFLDTTINILQMLESVSDRVMRLSLLDIFGMT
jgi:hypothetical protein